MTKGYWKCKICNYVIEIHISSFIKKCPKCGTEYELLGYLCNFHVYHDIPIFKIKDENFSNYLTNHYYLIIRCNQTPIIQCINEDFYTYLSNVQNNDIKIELVESRNIKPNKTDI